MQRPEINSLQRRMIEKDKEILMKSVIHDEDFKFYENFNYFKRQFESFNHFKQIFEENFFDYELLKAALVRKHENIANYLINDCCCRVRNPNKINLEETPLHLSMKLEDLSILKTILKKDASIYDKNLNGETPLHAAFKQKHYEAVTILLDYISNCNLSFNPDNEDDILHFHIACITLHMCSILLYLSLEFNVNSHVSVDSVKYPGLTPLLICLLESEDNYSTAFEFIQVLIMNGVDLNSSIPLNSEKFENKAGFTPLHLAVQKNSLELVELFLKNGANWNRLDKKGKTALHLACENVKTNQTIKIIEILLNCSGSLIAVDMFGKTPIHSAFEKIVKSYETNILDKLISNKTLKDNFTAKDGLSLFHIVCTRNKPDLVDDYLNSGVAIDSCVLSPGKFQGFSALHFAVYFNQKDVIEVLLKRNAPVNMKTHDLNTPLHLACAITPFTLYEVYEEYARQKIISNDEPIIVDWTANRNSQFDIIKLLLSYGADVEAKNIFDFTPLFHAFSAHEKGMAMCMDLLESISSSKEVHPRLTEIIKILLSNKANINCTNKDQLTILHVICNGLTKISDELMESLITAGADINAVDKDGLTPLHYAAEKGQEELVKTFLKYKANINVKCKNLKTPLQYAISTLTRYPSTKFIKECITILLENGSDVNVSTESGRTLLHDAVRISSYFLIKQLLYYGADINAEDSLGNSIMCSIFPDGIAIRIEVLCVIFVHVQKLLAIGCYVNEKLPKYCIYLQQYCKTKLPNTNLPRIMDNAFDGCINELNKAKIRKIDNYTSLYNFLLNNPHDLSKYVQNNTLIDIFEKENIDEEFPLYSYLLKLQYKKSLLRSDVLKFAKESLMHATSTNLPDLCYDTVLRYLTNEEVVNLKAAVGVKKRCSSTRKLNVIDLSETKQTINLQKKRLKRKRDVYFYEAAAFKN